jgi:hypothetical protein
MGRVNLDRIFDKMHPVLQWFNLLGRVPSDSEPCRKAMQPTARDAYFLP